MTHFDTDPIQADLRRMVIALVAEDEHGNQHRSGAALARLLPTRTGGRQKRGWVSKVIRNRHGAPRITAEQAEVIRAEYARMELSSRGNEQQKTPTELNLPETDVSSVDTSRVAEVHRMSNVVRERIYSLIDALPPRFLTEQLEADIDAVITRHKYGVDVRPPRLPDPDATPGAVPRSES